MNPKTLYWIDLETTGLDPESDSILEIAISRASFSNPFEAALIFEGVLPFQDWSAVDKYVIDMHHKSGLMIDCIRGGNIDTLSASPRVGCMPQEFIAIVERILLSKLDAYADDWIPKDGGEKMSGDELPVLAGSSVHFDRGFLRHAMPDFSKKFSHRYYDVSALKLFCRSLGMKPQLKKEAHRAFEDIKESIQHARECAEWLATAADSLRKGKEDIPF